MTSNARVAFVGLGNMGAPMARNLAVSGVAVSAFDLSASARDAAEGVAVTASLREALEGAGTLITMLPQGRHVVSVLAEALAHLPSGACHIDCSTIDMASARQLHVCARERGLLSVDAPVSGGTGGAQAATLTFMAGGSPEAMAHARPLLERMGKRVVHCGEGGAGQAAKICNNMILGVSMLAVSEAFVLGERLGLSHEALFDVASTSSGQCWSLTSYCPVPGPVPASPANNDYRPGFAAALMLKDLTLAAEAAEAAGASTPMGALAHSLYERFAAENGGRDFSAVVEALREGQLGVPQAQPETKA